MKVVAWVCGLTAAAMFIGARITGFQINDQSGLMLLCGLPLLAALFCPSFRLLLCGASAMFFFAVTSATLSYIAGQSHFHFVDDSLQRIDSMFGVDAHSIYLTVRSMPWLNWILNLAYASLMPQTVLIIAYLGLQGDHYRLSLFLQRGMICCLITILCFFVVPAFGSCGISPPDYYAPVVHDLAALKTGLMHSVTSPVGLITFPSYHTVCGILFVAAIPNRWMVILNSLLIASTIPVGMHYFTDLIGAVLLCYFVIPITHRQYHVNSGQCDRATKTWRLRWWGSTPTSTGEANTERPNSSLQSGHGAE